MSFSHESSFLDYSNHHYVSCNDGCVYYRFETSTGYDDRKILGFSLVNYNSGSMGTPCYDSINDDTNDLVLPHYAYDNYFYIVYLSESTDSSILLELEGEQPSNINYNESTQSTSYSEDCPFSYQYYQFDAIPFFSYEYATFTYLRIYKGDEIVYDENAGSQNLDSEDYAMSIMQPMIDDCIENSKIPTTCCVLVCCEPDKYRLVEA